MAQFTIDIPDAALPRLQAAVEQDNGNTGRSDTVQQWIERAVKLRMVQDDLTLAYQQLERQKQADLATAVSAARDALVDAITPAKPTGGLQ